ncbi:hypothetical protein LCGC14_0854410 [marine sediment metagenome]|uniref:Uncharacterized protein n=1 Tax=marine sediment metagenome TaxID=412755 RepID=A0A0F9PE52_9ZZZZ
MAVSYPYLNIVVNNENTCVKGQNKVILSILDCEIIEISVTENKTVE